MKFIDIITSDENIEFKYVRFLSLLLLILSCSICFIPFKNLGFLANLTGHVHNFTPGVLSSVISLFFVAPLYLRGKLKWSLSTYHLLSFLLITLLFSSFVELVVGNGTDEISSSYILIGMSVLLSWIGMRAIAGFSWVFVFAAVIINVVTRDTEMGFWGFVYIFSGFLGLILHAGLNPGEMFEELRDEFSRAITSQQKEEMQAAGDVTKQASEGIVNVVKTATKVL
ncbi:hypothetical protein [Marinomonas flavescens]|uniref:hypothetical protein n=1 Tax=Marinomonas flavescens TaxID=2529379 RepID=UPI0010564E0F|nr:hypothetical protein [Marinomonas flavescens]